MNTVTRFVSRSARSMTVLEAIREFCSLIPTSQHSGNILLRTLSNNKVETALEVVDLVTEAAEGKTLQVIWFLLQNGSVVLQYRHHRICYRLRIKFYNARQLKKIVFVIAGDNPEDVTKATSGAWGFGTPIQYIFVPKKFEQRIPSPRVSPSQPSAAKLPKSTTRSNGKDRFPVDKYAPLQDNRSQFEELFKVIGNIPMGEFLEFVAARNKQ